MLFDVLALCYNLLIYTWCVLLWVLVSLLDSLFGCLFAGLRFVVVNLCC